MMNPKDLHISADDFRKLTRLQHESFMEGVRVSPKVAYAALSLFVALGSYGLAHKNGAHVQAYESELHYLQNEGRGTVSAQERDKVLQKVLSEYFLELAQEKKRPGEPFPAVTLSEDDPVLQRRINDEVQHRWSLNVMKATANKNQANTDRIMELGASLVSGVLVPVFGFSAFVSSRRKKEMDREIESFIGEINGVREEELSPQHT